MATKFAELIESNKIDHRRLMSASRQIERLRLEDRQIKLAKQQLKKEGNAENEKLKEAAAKKARSGKVITKQLIAKATAGQKIPGAAKQRVLAAVNRILEQKKKDTVELKTLF